MPLVPAGKARLMVAQQYTNPLAQGYGDSYSSQSGQEEKSQLDQGLDMAKTPGLSPDDRDEMVKHVFTQPNEPDQTETESAGADDGQQLPAKEESSPQHGIKEFVFKKLEGLGYPGRRLMEFKDQMARIEITSDGTKTVQVIIPDKHYGNAQALSDSELKDMVGGVEKSFGLHFNGAKNDAGKWIIDFTSANLAAEKAMEEANGMQQDNLEAVYGAPASGKKQQGGVTEKKAPRKAETIHEMIKSSKSSGLIDQLYKIVHGDK